MDPTIRAPGIEHLCHETWADTGADENDETRSANCFLEIDAAPIKQAPGGTGAKSDKVVSTSL